MEAARAWVLMTGGVLPATAGLRFANGTTFGPVFVKNLSGLESIDTMDSCRQTFPSGALEQRQ